AKGVLGKDAGDAASADSAFGPHVRDLVIADGGKQAVMTTMNWDHNLYAIDAATGAVSWRQRAGHYFTFSPQALASGVAVQGFDLESGEGYHLYLAGTDGRLERRFGLYGIPKRLPHRFVPGIVSEDQHGLDNRIAGFAVPADGSWVATAGDLGLAVWSREGKPLWQQDWFKTRRHAAALAAIDAKTLLVIESMNASFYDAATGKKRSEVRLAAAGKIRKIVVSADGSTVAVLSTTDSGRVHILRKNAVVRVFPTAGEDVALSRDGSLLAVVDGNQLKLCAIDQGLQWSFAGDDALRFPRFSPDGKRIVVTSDLGAAYVLDRDGALLWEEDLGARNVPAWLPDGDLVLASWMGAVVRLGADYQPKWQSRLTPEATDMRDRLLEDDGAPTVKIASWGNAAVKPLPITPNLIAENPVICSFVQSGSWGGNAAFANDVKLLWDGSPEAPPQPWIGWNFVGFFAETSPVNYLQIDAFRKQLRVTAVTFVEDAAHPESWLRDATFDWWDAAAERWVTATAILADAPVHTHVFAEPIEAARFRVMLPWGVVGNLRFGELVLHGTSLGGSHPDVAAKRPVAVLFDEQDDIKRSLRMDNGVSFKLDAAYSGGRCLAIAAGSRVGAAWLPPFGHRLANWDFEIAESPQPGQYRWLQFACKAASANTKAVALMFSGDQSANLLVHLGERIVLVDGGVQEKQAAATPTTDWTVVRVDLWELSGRKPGRIQTMSLGADGDGAFVDQILLGRSEKELKATAVVTAGDAKPAKR
ncbi:MAG: PQQ-binding-like beta-propeller repeat protein, partial [Planctomycetes bacterium]|nr:PQQ-binding-like beta-propeller repeat protein [Planctomycetota bacterium]